MFACRRILAALTFSLLLTGSINAQDKDLPAKLLPPAVLPDAPDWLIGPYQGIKPDLSIVLAQGKPAFRVGKSGLVITSKNKLPSDVELRMTFRMTSPEDKGTWAMINPGMPKLGVPIVPLRLFMQVYANPEPEYMMWQLQPLPGQKDAPVGNYRITNLPKNRLVWPDLMRRRLETDTASEPRITERWITLRYQLRKNEARVFLDDRLLRAGSHPDLETSGFLQITLLRGVEVGSLEVVPLGPTDGRYETVPLEGYVNAERFRGDTVVLKEQGTKVQVAGVPFALPAGKRTHVDLKPSWLSCSMVPGDFYAISSDLERWGGALYPEPGRIQFRVPNGPYTKLHLLAAFSGETDTTPEVTAQFYRPQAGAPVNFAAKVPLFSAPATTQVLPAALTGGTKMNLHLVTIPLEPNGVSAFSDHDYLEFELTKKVRPFRGFPDPIQYSEHGGGLPSGVHVFGITLEKPAVEVDIQPDAYSHIWTAPAEPSYTATLRNTTKVDQIVHVEVRTQAFNHSESTVLNAQTKVYPGETQKLKLPLKDLKRYGHHALKFKVIAGMGKDTKPDISTVTRALAYLHPDTRERGDWQEGKGPIWGLWDWNGGHGTSTGVKRLQVMGAAGLESSMAASFNDLKKEDQAYLESIGAKTFFFAYQLAMNKNTLGGKEWDPKKPAEMQQALIDWLKKQPMAKASKIHSPELAVFFAEPLLGPVSYMAQPEHFGEPPHELTADEKAAYQKFLDQFLVAGQAIKKEWPQAKLLFPWGIPSFPIPFLRHSKEARDLMDGPALDVVLFERLPEMQIHQVTISCVMWQLKQEWLKHAKPWPNFTTLEGPCVSPAHPAALTLEQESDHTLRSFLMLAAYGNTRHLGYPVPFHCAGYWGETHYGTGLIDRMPVLTPRPVYSSYATLTRQLNRMNFVKQIMTDSNTVLCLQFKHYKTGELLHVVWTLRGNRPVTVTPASDKVSVHDDMDNHVPLVVREGGAATFVISSAPRFLRGLTGDAKFSLGSPIHSDTKPAAELVTLGELGDGTWKLSTERDLVYEDTHSEFIRRFPGKFTVEPTKTPDAAFGKALAVHLDKQEKERKTMPFYTTLVPAKPIVIPGKASHLGLWVKAASDWGRVVYCLKDAKGERWISVGQKGEWNVDDTHCWSQFCFDGQRYLRFEMPNNSPYDLYREMGTTYWGHYGEGDAIIDYPLTLEKIIVERRTHVIAGTEQMPASPTDVLLGSLNAEYETAADKTPEAIRLSKLRMPVPATPPDLSNPLQKFAASGTTPGPDISKIYPPEREYDGTRCHVDFTPDAKAEKYNIWVSPYADGRGAVLLGKDWTKPGQLLTGLSANIDLYLFVVATDPAGKPSRPGKAFKINLKNMFPMK